MACSLLASAYDTADSMGAPEIGRDLAASVSYRIKACRLGSGADCDIAGDALADGKGVPQDRHAALEYLRLGCESYNALKGFACGRLAMLLLDEDFYGKYDEAMSLLDRGCASQQTVCRLKELYVGTGSSPATTAPSGAVSYAFGLKQSEVVPLCAAQGGKFEPSKTGLTPYCETPMINALKIRAAFLSFDFCKRDELCAILIDLDTEAAKLSRRFYDLKSQLIGLYGPPSLSEIKTTPECRTIGVLAKCIESGRAVFSTTWSWDGKAVISLGAIAAHGDIALSLGYYSGAKVQELGASGL